MTQLQTPMQNAFAKAQAQQHKSTEKESVGLAQARQLYNAVSARPNCTTRKYSETTKINYSTVCNMLSFCKLAGLVDSSKHGIGFIWRTTAPWDAEAFEEARKALQGEWKEASDAKKAGEKKPEGPKMVMKVSKEVVASTAKETVQEGLNSKLDIGKLTLAEALYLFQELKKIFKD